MYIVTEVEGKAVGIREGWKWREMAGGAMQPELKDWGNLGGTP